MVFFCSSWPLWPAYSTWCSHLSPEEQLSFLNRKTMLLGTLFVLACHFLRAMGFFFCFWTAFELLIHFAEDYPIWILLKLEVASCCCRSANVQFFSLKIVLSSEMLILCHYILAAHKPFIVPVKGNRNVGSTIYVCMRVNATPLLTKEHPFENTVLSYCCFRVLCLK